MHNHTLQRLLPLAPQRTVMLLGLLLLGCSQAANLPSVIGSANNDTAAALMEETGSPAPLPNAQDRPVALRFGMYVTPDPNRNPIDPPERFTGYHVGLDFELRSGEERRRIPVSAICNGSVLYSGFAKGYGGLVVQRCQIANERVTVLYGHLDTRDAPPEDTVVHTGDQVGELAPPYSTQSDGNRKHLHLGIRRGEVSDFRGYVQSADEIHHFINPESILKPGAAGTPVLRYSVQQGPFSQP